MAVFARGFRRCFLSKPTVFGVLAERGNVPIQVTRSCSSANKLNESGPDYEVTYNPNEWKLVERLMPLRTVPPVSKKAEYPSGWRPPNEEALNHPYYVRRTKNHMLPVYLYIRKYEQLIVTRVKRIDGDIWLLHDELKEHLEKIRGRSIQSCVYEGNGIILFKGDFVYYCEQWLLDKGF